MAQQNRKTVPQNDRLSTAMLAGDNPQVFARQVPALAFLLRHRSRSRLSSVKKLFAKLLGLVLPVLAEQEPAALGRLLRQR